MRIRMLKIQAGPVCSRDIGKEYDVEREEAIGLIAAGAAVAVEADTATAAKPAAPEDAAKRTGKPRARKAPAGEVDD